MDINLNNATCLVEKQNFTHSVITNVCSGEVIEVAHGALDLLILGFLGLLMVALIVFFGGLVLTLKD